MQLQFRIKILRTYSVYHTINFYKNCVELKRKGIISIKCFETFQYIENSYNVFRNNSVKLDPSR
jgi:hypothetical protein